MPRTVDLYVGAVRRLVEIYPDPAAMPDDALAHLGDAMMSDGGGNPGTVNVALSGVRQWAAWLRNKGSQVPQLRSPAKDRWSKPPPVAVQAPELPPPVDLPAPPVVVATDPDALAAKRIMDKAARDYQRKAGASPTGAARTLSAASILPAMSSVGIWQRSPDTGRMVHRRDFNGRDLAGATSMEEFLTRWVVPKYPPSTPKGYEFEVIEKLPSGQQRNYQVELPISEDDDMSANGTAAEIRALREENGIEKTVAKLAAVNDAVRSMQGDGGGGGMEAEIIGLLKMKMSMKIVAEVFRELDGPPPAPPAPPLLAAGPDPAVAELTRKVDALAAKLTEGGGMKDAVLLASALQGPMIEVMRMQGGANKRGGLSELTEAITTMKALGIKFGAEADGGELVKLSTNVVEAIKAIKSMPALPAANAATPATAPVVLPPGFKAGCDALSAAPDNRHRVAAAADLLKMLAVSGDTRFVQLLLWLREQSIAAVAAADDVARAKVHAEMLTRIDPILVAFHGDGHITAEVRDATIAAFKEWIGQVAIMMAEVKAA